MDGDEYGATESWPAYIFHAEFSHTAKKGAIDVEKPACSSDICVSCGIVIVPAGFPENLVIGIDCGLKMLTV